MTTFDLRILTFAWVQTQTQEPDFTIQTRALTLGDLLDELIATRPGWQSLKPRQNQIRCALNQQFVDLDTRLIPGAEVAFFPPVTGG